MRCRGSVLSSGTVGAAMEGCIAGRRAVAVSFPFFQGWDNWTDADIDSAVQVGSLWSEPLALCRWACPLWLLKTEQGIRTSLQSNALL